MHDYHCRNRNRNKAPLCTKALARTQDPRSRIRSDIVLQQQQPSAAKREIESRASFGELELFGPGRTKAPKFRWAVRILAERERQGHARESRIMSAPLSIPSRHRRRHASLVSACDFIAPLLRPEDHPRGSTAPCRYISFRERRDGPDLMIHFWLPVGTCLLLMRPLCCSILDAKWPWNLSPKIRIARSLRRSLKTGIWLLVERVLCSFWLGRNRACRRYSNEYLGRFVRR